MRVLFWCLAITTVGQGQAPTPEFFEKQIRPVLIEQCHGCHGAKKQMAGLRLDSRAALVRGGESGPAVDLQKPENSLLLNALEHRGDVKMPPKGKLPEATRAAIAHWIKGGAPWPESTPSPMAKDGTHWAFQPLRRATPPNMPEVASPIDRWLLAKLNAKGLGFAPPAEKAVLLRRLTYDLTGLPPTLDETNAFLADGSPNAVATVVARLLQSPTYGEHLGRMWLDVARYADTKGYVLFEEAGYPWAYTYRDYVIEAFNNDLPVNRFILEQLAADRLVSDQAKELRALGFLTVGSRFMGNTHDVIDDRIDVITRGFLGLTVSCARCHDHKFDPVPQADYYSLYGVLASSEEPTVPPLYAPPPTTEQYQKYAQEMALREGKLKAYVQRKRDELAASTRRRASEYLLAAHANRDRPGQEDFMLLADGNDLNPKMIVRWQGYLRDTKRSKQPLFTLWHQLADIPAAEFTAKAPAILEVARQGPHAELLQPLFTQPPKTLADVATFYGALVQRGQAWLDVAQLVGGASLFRTPSEQALLGLLRAPEFPPNVTVGDYGDLDLLPDRPSQAEMQNLRKAVEQWRATGPGAPPRAMAIRDAPSPTTPRVFLRGNPYNLGPAVPRQFLACLTPDRRAFEQGSGRWELAQAIADPKNPLTARVFVNRLWQHFFGRGLVTTPGDFGLRGDSPSHPELLDELASQFIAEGWSVKKLVARIVQTRAYQQSSAEHDAGRKHDPENVLLWRMNRKRLGFEGLRDALLAASGKLDRTIGGPSVGNFLAPNATRRTMYGHLDRLNVPGVYRTFDFPAPDATSAKRELTTVPPQALFMMNHPFVAECAKNLLKRPDWAKLADDTARLEHVYALLFQRPPDDRERLLGQNYLKARPTNGWSQYVHALLMTNEFMFID